MSIYVLGCDISLNHSAVVLLRFTGYEVDLVHGWFATERADVAKRANAAAPQFTAQRTPPRKKGEALDQWTMRRLEALRDLCRYIRNRLLAIGTEVDLVAVEDLTRGSRSSSTHELAGAAYLFRTLWWLTGARLRFYEPSQIRKFVGAKGNAGKNDAVAAVEAAYPDVVDLFGRFAVGDSPAKRTTYEDLVDAYAAGRVGVAEFALRGGLLDFRDLPEHAREVFHRTTDKHPENLLVRPYVERVNP